MITIYVYWWSWINSGGGGSRTSLKLLPEFDEDRSPTLSAGFGALYTLNVITWSTSANFVFAQVGSNIMMRPLDDRKWKGDMDSHTDRYGSVSCRAEMVEFPIGISKIDSFLIIV